MCYCLLGLEPPCHQSMTIDECLSESAPSGGGVGRRRSAGGVLGHHGFPGRKWCPRHNNILRRSPLSPDTGLLGTRFKSQDRWCPGTPPAVPGHLVSEDTLRTRLASQDSARSVLRRSDTGAPGRTSLRILEQDDRMEPPESPRKTKKQTEGGRPQGKWTPSMPGTPADLGRSTPGSSHSQGQPGGVRGS